MIAFVENSVNQLVAVLDTLDRETRGRPALKNDQRCRVILCLERSLVDFFRLQVYVKFLQRILSKHARYSELLQEDRLREVLRAGLTVLNDEELVHLALNPLALSDLYHWVLGEFGNDIPDYWWNAISKAALAHSGNQIG